MPKRTSPTFTIGCFYSNSSRVPLSPTTCPQVKAPWIKTFFYCGDDTYIIPGVDHVTLGGSRTFGATSLHTDEHESRAIWERCTRYVPSLKRAEVSEPRWHAEQTPRHGVVSRKGVTRVRQLA